MLFAYTILNALILLYYLVVITAARNMSISTSNMVTDSTVTTTTILKDTIQQKGATGSMNDGEHIYNTTAHVNKATDYSSDHTVENDGTILDVSVSEFDKRTDEAANEYNTTAHVNKAMDSSSDHTVESDGTLLDVSVSEFDKGTEETDSEINNIHSGFNLAVIPAVAVLVFIVITCIKCCEWFRQYSRGGSNDEKYYAVTIHDGEDDYDRIDMISDSTSTAYYDTVSSYCSFLKRSGNDSTVNSIRALRQHDTRNVQCSPPHGLIPLGMRSNTKENTISESEMETEASRRKRGTDESQVTYYARTSSTSSADTTSEQLMDTPIFRRSNKFRVSFVEQNPSKLSAIEHKLLNSSNVNDKALRSSLKGSPYWEMKTSNSSIQEVRCFGRKMGKTTMVDVGTQTNKSFRYSLRRTKRHASDTDVDERLTFNAIPSMVTRENKLDLQVSCGEIQVTQHPKNTHVPYSTNITYNGDTSTASTGRPSLPQLGGKCSNVNDIPDRANYPFETNVEIIHNCHQSGKVDVEPDDDVFIENVVIDGIPHNNVDSCSIIGTPCDTGSKTTIENCITADGDTCMKTNSDNCMKSKSDNCMNTNTDNCMKTNSDNCMKTKSDNCMNKNTDNCMKTKSDNCMKTKSDNCMNCINSITSTKTVNKEDSNKNHGQCVLCLCSHCKTIVTYDIAKQLGDTVGDTVNSEVCEKCTMLHIHEDTTVRGTQDKKKVSSIIVQGTTTTLPDKNNETRSSLLSLESSGYAELSSSDSG